MKYPPDEPFADAALRFGSPRDIELTRQDEERCERVRAWFKRIFEKLAQQIDRYKKNGWLPCTGAAEPETDEQLEKRLLKQDAGDMLRLIDYIADKIGLPHNEELSRDNFNAWLATPVRGDREAIISLLVEKFPGTFTRYGVGKKANAFAGNVADAILSLPVQPGAGERE